MTRQMKTARHIALDVLNEFDVDKHNASEILNSKLSLTDERSRATDIVFGVIRSRATLDRIISNFAGRDKKRIAGKLLNILRIGAYELIFTPVTAEYAVVNEAVNLAGSVGGKKQTGFVNAVLRNITRGITSREIDIDLCDKEKTIPHSQKAGCQFKRNILPSPETDPSDYLSEAFSLPKWLIRNWLSEFGFAKTKQICFASNRKPSVFLAVNTLKTSRQGFSEKLTADGVEFELSPSEAMIKLKSPRSVARLYGYREGLFNVQDPTASLAVRMLSPQPGQTIIDLCSAPGGKTVQMAQLMNNSGRIIATDIDSDRLKKVEENCSRLGITIVEIVPYGQIERTLSELPRCDAVLLDVPCSNTGVLARRCEVRLRLKPRAVKDICKAQTILLETAAKRIGNGGKICYSTCSILRQENSDIVNSFLSNTTGFTLMNEKLTLPADASCETFDHDGGYTAIITKNG